MPSQPIRSGHARVTGLTHDGRGVARAEGKTVFIEGALPGEEVRYQVSRSRPRFDEARLLEVQLAAADRVPPPCPHYGACGGCNLQHLAPPAQLAAKQQQLADTLQRIGGLQPLRWLEPIGSPPWGYRARTRFAISSGKKGAPVALGLRREGSRQVEALRVCPVVEPSIEALIAPLAAVLSRLEHPERLFEVWMASGENGRAMAFQVKTGVHRSDRETLLAFGREHGVMVQFSAEDGSWPAPSESLVYRCSGSSPEIRFQPWHFTQANRVVNHRLVETVMELLQPEAAHRALDLFCGLGNFTLPLAQHCAHVTGIEGDAALVQSARENAARNGLGNTDFIQADLATGPGRAPWTGANYDLVVLDPPRSGAAALLPVLVRLGASRLCYVSCDAATLARDARALHENSRLRLQAAGVLDMFPQTGHFESITLFA